MSFSCKIILRDYRKADGTRRVYLRAVIDRKKAMVPLAFAVKDADFDERRQCMRKGYANKDLIDTVFQQAIAKANEIAARYMIEGKYLSTSEFCAGRRRTQGVRGLLCKSSMSAKAPEGAALFSFQLLHWCADI